MSQRSDDSIYTVQIVCIGSTISWQKVLNVPPAAPSPGGWGSAAPRGRSGPGPCWTAARGPGEREYLGFRNIW